MNVPGWIQDFEKFMSVSLRGLVLITGRKGATKREAGGVKLYPFTLIILSKR